MAGGLCYETNDVRSADEMLHTHTWHPGGSARALIVLVHGQADHGARYDHVGRALAERGYVLHIADLRGHGHSSGRRGHVDGPEGYRADVDAAVRSGQEALPGCPWFLAGQSLGAALALDRALRDPTGCRGVIATGTWLALAFEPPAWKVTLGWLANAVAPGITMSNELDAAQIARSATAQAAYRSDPLIHGVISARAFFTIREIQGMLRQRAEQFTLPLLMMHGGDDPIADRAAAEAFYAAAASEDKTFKTYDNLYHEILNEAPWRTIVDDLADWLDAQIGVAQGTLQRKVIGDRSDDFV